MRKVLAVVLALVMVLSLTACGGGLSTGKYKLTSYKMGDQDLSSLVSLLGEDSFYIEIIDGEKGKIAVGDEAEEFTYDGSNFISNGQKMPYKASGNKITITIEEGGQSAEMVFEK